MGIDTKYGVIILAPERNADKVVELARKSFEGTWDVDRVREVGPRNEPLFVLRGQDELAAATIRYYASLRAIYDTKGALEVNEAARRFEAYAHRKQPS